MLNSSLFPKLNVLLHLPIFLIALVYVLAPRSSTLCNLYWAVCNDNCFCVLWSITSESVFLQEEISKTALCWLVRGQCWELAGLGCGLGEKLAVGWSLTGKNQVIKNKRFLESISTFHGGSIGNAGCWQCLWLLEQLELCRNSLFNVISIYR